MTTLTASLLQMRGNSASISASRSAERGMIALDNRHGGSDGIGLVQHRIRARDSRIVGDPRAQHVAEVHDRRHAPRIRVVAADEHVVVVGVVVDHAGAEPGRKARQFILGPGEEPFGQLAPGAVGHEPEVLADPAGAAGIPLEVAVCRRMVEVRQRRVHRPQQRSQASEKFRRMRADARQHRARHPRQQPNQVRPPLRVGDRRRGGAVDRVLHARKVQTPAPWRPGARAPRSGDR